VPARDGRPGRVELLPAVPAFLPAGRLRGARTLTQVGLDLAWNLKTGAVAADLRSRIAQRIELTWRAATGCQVTGCRDPITAGRPGSWRLELPEEADVHVRMKAAAMGEAPEEEIQ
jgi:hypothetical protein